MANLLVLKSLLKQAEVDLMDMQINGATCFETVRRQEAYIDDLYDQIAVIEEGGCY